MTDRRRIRTALALALLAAGPAAPDRALGQVVPTPQFEKDVLPVLSARCLKCHGGPKPKAGLDLHTRTGMLKGGESGPVLVPGNSARSLLFEMIRKGEMPPSKETRLTAQQIALVKAWIDGGAPAAQAAPPVEVVGKTITEKDRKFWAFQKPVRPPVPRVRSAERIRTPIDAFILAKLESKGLTLSPDADRATLLRRVCFDLTGLPPSPEEVDAFLADTRPDAYERVVDRLLASPHYGERWGRHWLDAAGYSDSVGGDNDPGQLFIREGMWRYRDYVVRALNEDRPYDRFLTEQLAGDELDDWRSAPMLTATMREHLVATGLLRTSVDHTTEDELNRPFERYQVLHDTIENLTSNLLGLTVACARCHDHKFDPIPQVEYYRLLAVLKPVFNPEAWIQPQHRHLDDVSAKDKEAITRQLAELNQQLDAIRRPHEKKLFEARLAKLPEAIRADTAAALATPAESRNAVQKYLAEKLGPSLSVPPEEVTRSLSAADQARAKALDKQLAALKGRQQTLPKIQAAWEAWRDAPPPAHVLRRGNHVTPGAEVQPGVFTVLTDPQSSTLIPPPGPGAKTSGRRTAWARWLTRPDHPLTARVFVNRVWQHHFGEGLVATSDNFGHLGSRPTHPELLDWLATQFVSPSPQPSPPGGEGGVRGGWSVKALHRLILLSSTYQMACVDNATAARLDPDNRLLWRMPRRRLEAETLRDAVLAVGGRLDRAVGGGEAGEFLYREAEIIDTKRGFAVNRVKGDHPFYTRSVRRSLYLPVVRNMLPDVLALFDPADPNGVTAARTETTVPSQALFLLNHPFVREQSLYFARSLLAAPGDDAARVRLAHARAFARPPSPNDVADALAFLKEYAGQARRGTRESGSGRPDADVRLAAWQSYCQMLYCSNEFAYLD